MEAYKSLEQSYRELEAMIAMADFGQRVDARAYFFLGASVSMSRIRDAARIVSPDERAGRFRALDEEIAIFLLTLSIMASSGSSFGMSHTAVSPEIDAC